MEYSPGELIDRYTILKLKEKHGIAVGEELGKVLYSLPPLETGKEFQDILTKINQEIWDLEHDIRNGVKMTLSEIGWRAIQIRIWNSLRVFIKNQINEHYGKGYKEVKV